MKPTKGDTMQIDTDGFNYSVLNALTAQIDDLEQVRIAVDNRRRVLVTPRDKIDKDGKSRGLGLTEDDTLILGPIDLVVEGVVSLEKQAVRSVEKYMRHSPWGPWLDSERSRGVGAKQLARLLGATGDPYWHVAEDRPRRVGELWSYSGYAVRDGEAPKRRRGEQSNWSDDARKRGRLISESCLKSGGYYEGIYREMKVHYADAVHNRECRQCGPSGKPALPGSPISDGHRHSRALRKATKELLRDLWVESRRQHGVLNNEDGFDLVAA
jgi:hypothetical protein